MERLERIALLAHTDELDRLAGNGTHGQRGTATGITVDLGQDHAGQRQGITERLGGVGSILTGHGVDDEQGFCRLDGRMQFLDLGHHLGIDVQATCGIEDDHVDELQLRFSNGCASDVYRLLAQIGRKEGYPDFIGQGFELLDRCRTINVGRDHHDGFLFALFKEARQLAGGGGFTRTLQTGHQHNGWRRDIKDQVLVGSTHQAFKLSLDDLHKRLARRQAAGHFSAYSALFDRVDEVFDDRQRYVGFQQRHAHFTQGVFDIVLGQLGLAGNMAQRLRETIG